MDLGIGFSEIVLIFGLALVVLGPEKLPKVVANIGRWVGRARAMARQFREQLETEADNLKSGVTDVKTALESSVSEIQSGVNSGVAEVNQQIAAADKQLDLSLKPTDSSPENNHTDLGQHERGP